MTDNYFEMALPAVPQPMQQSLIDVCDTMTMARRWFEAQKMTFTAADVVAVAALVLEREEMEQLRTKAGIG